MTNPPLVPAHNFRTKFKNDLYAALSKAVGEDRLSEFEWVEPSRNATRVWTVGVRHVPTDAVFTVLWEGAFNPDLTRVKFTPHATHLTHTAQGAYSALLGHLREWDKAIQEELAVADQWEHAKTELVISPSIVQDYDTDFTEPEIARIGESFKAATEEIYQKRLLTPEQLAELTQVLSKQHAEAKTRGRIAWATAAATAVVHHLLKKGVDAVNVQRVMDVLGKALDWLNTHLGDAASRAIALLTASTSP